MKKLETNNQAEEMMKEFILEAINFDSFINMCKNQFELMEYDKGEVLDNHQIYFIITGAVSVYTNNILTCLPRHNYSFVSRIVCVANPLDISSYTSNTKFIVETKKCVCYVIPSEWIKTVSESSLGKMIMQYCYTDANITNLKISEIRSLNKPYDKVKKGYEYFPELFGKCGISQTTIGLYFGVSRTQFSELRKEILEELK